MVGVRDMALDVVESPRIVKITQGNADAYAHGQVTSPAAGAVIANFAFSTGGPYSIYFCLSASDAFAVGKRIDLEWTNAAGTVVYARLASVAPGGGMSAILGTRAYVINQVIRAIVPVAGDAGSVYTAVIAAWRSP